MTNILLDYIWCNHFQRISLQIVQIINLFNRAIMTLPSNRMYEVQKTVWMEWETLEDKPFYIFYPQLSFQSTHIKRPSASLINGEMKLPSRSWSINLVGIIFYMWAQKSSSKKLGVYKNTESWKSIFAGKIHGRIWMCKFGCNIRF